MSYAGSHRGREPLVGSSPLDHAASDFEGIPTVLWVPRGDPHHQEPAAVSGVFWAQAEVNRCLSCPSGICLCGHHTEGPSCERCLPGFYGNPFTGHTDDCQPCPCPGRSSCATLPESGEVVCTHCPRGQRGEWLVPGAPGVGSCVRSVAEEGGPAWG